MHPDVEAVARCVGHLFTSEAILEGPWLIGAFMFPFVKRLPESSPLGSLEVPSPARRSPCDCPT
jgi:hypothetical protein